MKKKIAFMAPSTKGGPYYIYKDIVKGLNKEYGEEIKAYFFNTKKDRLKLHFTKYDIIFSVIPFLFKPLGTKKYFYNIHGNFEIEKKRKNIGNKLLYLSKYNMNFCDKIILNSMFLADKLGFGQKFKNKIEIIPNPINIDTNNLKIKKLKDTNNLKILTVSSTKFIEKGMGIVDLAKQIKNIKDKKITWTIIAGGNKQNKKIIQKEFNKIKFTDNIKINWIDWIKQNKLSNYYKENDIFIYGTRLDTWGQTITEAMSYGLPVILLEYELWKYIYPEEIITDDINYKLKEVIKNYIKYSELSLETVKKNDLINYIYNVIKI